jgi:translation initiation factor IF-2
MTADCAPRAAGSAGGGQSLVTGPGCPAVTDWVLAQVEQRCPAEGPGALVVAPRRRPDGPCGSCGRRRRCRWCRSAGPSRAAGRSPCTSSARRATPLGWGRRRAGGARRTRAEVVLTGVAAPCAWPGEPPRPPVRGRGRRRTGLPAGADRRHPPGRPHRVPARGARRGGAAGRPGGAGGRPHGGGVGALPRVHARGRTGRPAARAGPGAGRSRPARLPRAPRGAPGAGHRGADRAAPTRTRRWRGDWWSLVPLARGGCLARRWRGTR